MFGRRPGSRLRSYAFFLPAVAHASAQSWLHPHPTISFLLGTRTRRRRRLRRAAVPHGDTLHPAASRFPPSASQAFSLSPLSISSHPPSEYPLTPARQGETLHILVTRHPYEWVSSMRRNAFYATFHKNLDMGSFLTLQWMSVDVKPEYQSM
jgi:hypothetical protein